MTVEASSTATSPPSSAPVKIVSSPCPSDPPGRPSGEVGPFILAVIIKADLFLRAKYDVGCGSADHIHIILFIIPRLSWQFFRTIDSLNC